MTNSMPTAGAPPGVYPGHVSSIQERDFVRDPERILSVPAYWGLEGDAAALLNHPTVQVRHYLACALCDMSRANEWHRLVAVDDSPRIKPWLGAHVEGEAAVGRPSRRSM